jgi:hypothetical protein
MEYRSLGDSPCIGIILDPECGRFSLRPAPIFDQQMYYIHTGHYHHLDEKGHMGCRVHQHTTLAANDAYSARAGYVPDREACAIVYSKTRGQVARIYEPPGV